MKNLLIYVNPRRDFDEENKTLIKLQIDNSLKLGWRIKDILLVTNFPYEYSGVKSFVIGDEYYCELFPQATKIDVIVHLFNIGFIKDNELYWVHDFDAYQQEIITEQELDLDNVDIGLTDYGRNNRWNNGSAFIKKECINLYHLIKKIMYTEYEDNKGRWKNEEDVLMKLTDGNVNNINSRIKRLNITYNFGIKKMKICYDKAIKPIKILHFHPTRIYWNRTTAWDIVKGKNELGFPVINQRLIKLFNKYGYI